MSEKKESKKPGIVYKKNGDKVIKLETVEKKDANGGKYCVTYSSYVGNCKKDPMLDKRYFPKKEEKTNKPSGGRRSRGASLLGTNETTSE